eukprot:1147009-Pelagomonas_calceolata.AAC.3
MKAQTTPTSCAKGVTWGKYTSKFRVVAAKKKELTVAHLIAGNQARDSIFESSVSPCVYCSHQRSPCSHQCSPFLAICVIVV